MQKKLICLLVAACMPGLAMADTTSAEIKALEAQLNALQKQVTELRAEVAAKAAAPVPVAADVSSPDYGKQPAVLTNDEVTDLKQQVAGQGMKVDSLQTAATTGSIAGLSVSGYLDPTYIYNRDANSASFLFANHEPVYNYFNSTFGDLYLDIKKTFGVGPMAPSAEVTLMPNRGNGISLLQNSKGSTADNIINTAVINVPVSGTTTIVAGLIPSFGGYDVQQSNQINTITHNLLYDFSDPGSYVGAGFNYTADGSRFAWKFFVGNEQYRTYGSVVQTGTNAYGAPVTQSNRIPTLTTRVDYTWSSALDVGGSLNVGRQTLAAGPTGSTGFGPVGRSSNAFGSFLFGETDLTYALADLTYNAELDYGQQSHAAFNGNQAQWFGLSLQANWKFNVAGIGRMGTTLRYDFLDDQKNGGGGGGMSIGGGTDVSNGFGVDPSCNASGSTTCKGANRQDVAFDLLFYPTQQLIFKVEYRHDMASQSVFLRNDGSYTKSNDMLATQMVYTF